MNQYLFLYGKGFSDFASRINFIASTSFLIANTNSSIWLAVYFLSRQIGAILSSVIISVLPISFSNKRLMIIGDLLCGITMIVLCIYPSPVTVIVSAGLIGAMYPIFQVSFQAILPDLFGKHALVSINSLLMKITSVISIIGFLVGGIIAYKFGYRMVLLFDGITYFVSLLTILKLKEKETNDRQELRTTPFVNENKSLKKLFSEQPLLRHLIIGSGVYAFAVSGYNFGLPLLSTEFAEYHSIANGLMWSSVAVGTLLGAIYFKCNTSLPNRVLPLVGFVYSVLMILPFLNDNLIFVVFILILVGFIESGFQISHATLVQSTHSIYLNRVLGINEVFVRIGFFCGFLIFPLLEQKLPLYMVILMMNLGLFFVSYQFWRYRRDVSFTS